jgi:protein-L-isoaspartate(D-aspartate) O-methyltransferase
VANLGHLCRAHFGPAVYSVALGTDHGTVLAARAWDEAGERQRVRRTPAGSYEHLFHQAGIPAFSLPLRKLDPALREELAVPHSQRTIGLVSDGEGFGHFEELSLPARFDEYVWFDETRALSPLTEQISLEDVHDTWPFGV